MTRRYRGLLLTGDVAVICWITVLSGAPTALRSVAAIALLFLLPGYAVLKVLGLDGSLGVVEEAVLGLGASCAVAVVVAVGIGLSSTQLHDTVFATALVALVLVALALAWLRGIRSGPSAASVTEGTARKRLVMPRAGRLGVPLVLWLTAITLVVAALFVASGAAQPQSSDVVQLWISRQDGGAKVGIYNGTTTTSVYRLTIGPAKSAPGTADISIEVTLEASGQWENSVQFPTTWPAGTEVVANLYQAGETSPFRMVKLVPSSTASQ